MFQLQSMEDGFEYAVKRGNSYLNRFQQADYGAFDASFSVSRAEVRVLPVTGVAPVADYKGRIPTGRSMFARHLEGNNDH